MKANVIETIPHRTRKFSRNNLEFLQELTNGRYFPSAVLNDEIEWRKLWHSKSIAENSQIKVGNETISENETR